ncbi:MAG: hypothetical protein WA851_06455, partial [Xanthobacteraceae bacterium]
YLGLQFGAWERQVMSGVLLLISLATVPAAASVLPFISPFPDIFGLAPLVCAILLYAAIRVLFQARAIEFFRHISSSLYLLHAIVISEVGAFLISDGYSSWTAAAACVGVACVLSAITLVVIERPAIAAGRRLVKLFSRAKVGACIREGR